MMRTSLEKALGTKRFQQNQAIFRRYTSVDGYLKNQIVTTVQTVFLYPLADQLTGFRQVSSLAMLHNVFTLYREIDEIDLKENAVKMMEPYDPVEPLS